jgi:hypothetical protein
LARAPEFAKLPQHQPDRRDDPFVGIEFDLAELVPAVPGRQAIAQLATARFRVASRKSAGAEQAQFVLGHRALEPEQQPVVHDPRVVHTVGIDQ